MFPELMSAVRQAKVVLAEIARDGLPASSVKALVIEVQNADHKPAVGMKLELQTQWFTA